MKISFVLFGCLLSLSLMQGDLLAGEWKPCCEKKSESSCKKDEHGRKDWCKQKKRCQLGKPNFCKCFWKAGKCCEFKRKDHKKDCHKEKSCGEKKCGEEKKCCEEKSNQEWCWRDSCCKSDKDST